MRGHVRKHGSNWQYTVELEPDPVTNKRRQKSKGGFRTKKECEKALAEIITKLENGQYFEIKKTNVREYLNYWLDAYAKISVAPSTYTRYNQFATTIIQYLGNVSLEKLKPADIQHFYTELTKKSKLSNNTILKIHRMFHLSLKHAVQWQILFYNPTNNVKAPKFTKSEMKVWTSETADNFLKDIKDTTLYLPVMLAITTGMRQGEIAALKWKNVNFENGFISVTHNMQRIENRYELKKPKTAKSKRSIAMMDLTIKELKKHKTFQKELLLSMGKHLDDDNFICCWDDGSPYTPHYISDNFRKYVSKLQYPKIRFHDLRHTHATMLLSKGVNPKIVSERLGHSTVSITLDTYSHVLPNMQKEAVKKLNNLFECQN